MKSISRIYSGWFIREFRILTDCGVILAAANGVRILLMYRNMKLAVIVSISLIGTVVISKIIGCIAAAGKEGEPGSGDHGRSDYYHAGGYMFDSDLLLLWRRDCLHYKECRRGNGADNWI